MSSEVCLNTHTYENSEQESFSITRSKYSKVRIENSAPPSIFDVLLKVFENSALDSHSILSPIGVPIFRRKVKSTLRKYSKILSVGGNLFPGNLVSHKE